MVPFQHWLELTRIDPKAAHEFLSAYLINRAADALPELRIAYANLARQRSEEPHLLTALDQLRVEIARREHALPRVGS
jgi:hypothetical protein